MARSPHASHLNPRWGVDPHWTEAAGGPAAAVALSGGQVVIDAPAPPPTAPKRAAIPCLHLGAPVRGAAAPDTVRDYRRCDHPDQPLGEVVCSCRGCNSKCVGYSA